MSGFIVARGRTCVRQATWMGLAVCLALIAPSMSCRRAPSSGPRCSSEVDGLAPLLRAGAVLLFGEIHGTNEIPDFFAEVACHASARGLPLIVGLEVADVDISAIRGYVRSEAQAQQRAELLAAPHWRPAFADGRSSEAMLRLVERLRVLSVGGASLELVSVQAGGEAGAARTIAEARSARPDGLVLALAGNNHTCVSDDCSPYRGFGWHLVHDHGLEVTSLNAHTTGGSFWGVTRNARGLNHLGERQASGGRARWRVETFAERKDGFDGLFHVGQITASFPAGLTSSH
jgi:hypothetical protein